MAIYRKVSITFWSDTFVQSLTPEKKFFYLYLMTNTKTKQCGIYEITMSQICFDTGYNQETVIKLIEFFEKSGKVKHSKRTNEIALKNWPKYNDSKSPKVLSCIESELRFVKNRVLIEYLYSIDTLSQQEQEQEQTKEEEQKEVTPLAFASKEFHDAWMEWFQFRKEIKKTLKESTIKKQMQFLGARAESEAIAIINQSIKNGWTGLFDIKQNGHGSTKNTASSEIIPRKRDFKQTW